MIVNKRAIQSLLIVVTGAVFAASASPQITTRLTVPGGSATSTKVIAGSPVSFDLRVDTTVGTIGAAYFLRQSSPSAAPFPFQITDRSLSGVPYNDAGSEMPGATITALPAALLAPATTVNLGSTKLAGVPAATNILVSNITVSTDPATTLGTYVIKPDPGNAFMTSDAADMFADYDMSSATFTVLIGQQISVTVVGGGTVSADSGTIINCAPALSPCTDIYPGSVVALTPTATAPATFQGWSGACTGTGACVVTVDQARSVTATFGFVDYFYTVAIAGLGAGRVTGTGGVNCPGICNSIILPYGTTVTVIATPAPGSTFNGWSGGTCSGTTVPCVFTSGASSPMVTATFDTSFTLTVTKPLPPGAGLGIGTVTSSPAGINCGSMCGTQAASFAGGSVVTLTAVADPGYIFTNFTGGGCSASPCNVTLNAATTVMANFADVSPPVTTILSGPPTPQGNAISTFTFSINETSTFGCSLDGEPFVACASPYSISVGNGVHTMTIRATDQAGNVEAAPPTYTWTGQGIALTLTAIPTLSEWMLAVLALMLGAMGYLAMRLLS